MSASTLLEVGDTVPVILQIADGNAGLYPQAEIRDDAANLLVTLDLSHQAEGLYVPAAPYSMPDEIFIKITYIVYTDAGHTTESDVYLRDIDVFCSINPVDYKATGFAVPNEYDAVLGTLSTEANATSNKNEVTAEVNANETKIDTIIGAITLLNNLSIADVQAALTAQGYTSGRATLLDYLDATISSRSSHSAADIWAHASAMFLLKIIKNKKVLAKNVTVWELIIYDDDNTTPILNKAIKDKDGGDITDLEAGVLAQEIATSV